ncbi:MAG: exoribonuclease II [Aeromonadaceae bacterium]
MFHDNPLLAQLKQQLRENLPKKEGVVRGSDRGFGFLETDNRESYFIPPQQMKKVMHGDRITAIIRTENEKEQAEPETLITPFLSRFVGRIKLIKDRLNVVPDHPVLKEVIKARPIKGLDEKQFAEGDWVIAHLKRHGLTDNGHFAEISERITAGDDPEAPWWVVLRRHDLPRCAPADAESWQQLDEPLPREDLTALPFVTIDGASTKDMDDALYVVTEADGWRLTVAIADPTAYVAPGSPIDAEAAKRAFTVYLPGRNIPMIPRTLSDELCSLKEGEPRQALCCEMKIGHDGAIADDFRFFAATICSQGRLIYDQVSDLLEHGSADGFTPNDAIRQQLQGLQALTAARQQWRGEHALLFSDRPDYAFELNEAGAVVAIHVEPRRIANRMVEEAMIAANICAGLFLARTPGYGIFNVHPGFDAEKIAGAAELLAAHQAPVAAERLGTLEGFCELRRWLETLPSPFLDCRLRRYQTYSVMASQPGPHFGLGLPAYATWTSPIRKYGDMVNHRIIKALLQGAACPAEPDAALTQLLSEARRLNRFAERDIADWLYVRFLLPAVGSEQTFSAEIIDVVRGGIKVRLQENGAVAFVPAGQIFSDKKRLECSWDDGKVYLDKEVRFELGQRIDVRLKDAIEATRSLVATLATPLDAATQSESAEELEHEVREAVAEALDHGDTPDSGSDA